MYFHSIQNSFQSAYTTVLSHVTNESSKVINEAKGLAKNAETTLIQATIDGAKKYTPIILEKGTKILHVVEKVIRISIFLSVALVLFSTNTLFFLLGASAAIVFPNEMKAAINRISQIWQSLPFIGKIAVFLPLPLAWPSYFIIAAPFMGASVCLTLQERALKMFPAQQESETQTAHFHDASTQCRIVAFEPVPTVEKRSSSAPIDD